jgi:uncharacterized membrane protein YccC
VEPVFLAITPDGVAQIASLGQSLTVVGVLAVIAFVLWKIVERYMKKTAEDAEQAKQQLIETLKKSHEETAGLLKQQLAEAEEQSDGLLADLREEKASREREWHEHIKHMEDITAEYRQSLEQFGRSMNEVQVVLKEQTSLLREIAGLPQKVDQLAKDVNALWKVQHERDEKEG